jgi:hypothetical protein
LPYLGEEELYKEFHLNEPWDSEHNKKLLDRMPAVYALDPEQPGSATVFQVFVGKEAPFLGNNRPRFPASFRDGISNTIFVAEAGEAVPWTKPVDLPFDPKGLLPRLGGARAEGFFVGMGDGSVHLVHKGVSVESIRAAITPAGGERLEDGWWSK